MNLTNNSEATLAQLPATAKSYYLESTRADVVWSYHFNGVDEAGNFVFTVFNGYSMVRRALIPYLAFAKTVRGWARKGCCIGVPKWTQPFGRTTKKSFAWWRAKRGSSR